MFNNIGGSGTVDSFGNRIFVIKARNIAQANCVTSAKFETKEILESAGKTRSPVGGGQPGERCVVDENRAGGWLVHFCDQLHKCCLTCAVLANNGNYRACGKGK